MPGLDHVLTYTICARGPLGDTAGPAGRIQYWEMADARITGAGPHGEVDLRLALPGSDWMQVGDDGWWRPDVRIAFASPEGDTVLLHYTGLVEQTAAFTAAAEADRETGFDQVNIRMVMRFETGAARYVWLTQSIFVADGRLLGTGRLEYRIHRLT